MGPVPAHLSDLSRRAAADPQRRRLADADGSHADRAAVDITVSLTVSVGALGARGRAPTGMRLPDAVRYVLRVPTNRILILASALGWFFFASVRTFAVIFIRGQFGVGQAAATGMLALVGVGALAGVLTGGRLSDMLIDRGHLSGRLG